MLTANFSKAIFSDAGSREKPIGRWGVVLTARLMGWVGCSVALEQWCARWGRDLQYSTFDAQTSLQRSTGHHETMSCYVVTTLFWWPPVLFKVRAFLELEE